MVRIGQANGVIAITFYGLENRVVILCPKAVDNLIGGFETIPVDPGNAYGTATGIDDLIAAGMPVSGTLPKGDAARCKKQERTAARQDDMNGASRDASPAPRW